MPEGRCTRQEISYNSRVGYKKSYEKLPNGTYQRKCPSRHEKRRKRSWQRRKCVQQNKTELMLSPNCPMVNAKECGNKPITAGCSNAEEILSKSPDAGYNKYPSIANSRDSKFGGVSTPSKENIKGNPKALFVTSSESRHEPYVTKNHNTENNTVLILNISFRTQPPCSFSELGIVTERPKFPQYTLKESRTKTFNNWPSSSCADKEYLVIAGFFFTGNGDTVCCFFCEGALGEWRKKENPWIEHAKAFPQCGYLQLRMGSDFINDVQMTVDTSLLTSACISSYIDEPDSLLNEPSARVLLDHGLDERLTLRAASLVKSLGGMLSSDAIKETMKELCHPENETTATLSAQDLEEIKQLKKANSSLRQLMICKLCKNNDVQVVFLPCGHLLSCVECSLGLTDCPACRIQIIGISRVFINRHGRI